MRYYTKQKNKTLDRGFTLIEMIVSVSLFTVVSLIAIGALISISSANRKVNSLRTTMDNINFAMEVISRDIRTGTSYSVTGNNKKMTFTDQGGIEVQYRHQGSSIQVKNGPGGFTDITSPEINVEDLSFYVVGVGTDGRQPRVLITIRGTAGVQDKVISTFNLQTTISQRSLDS